MFFLINFMSDPKPGQERTTFKLLVNSAAIGFIAYEGKFAQYNAIGLNGQSIGYISEDTFKQITRVMQDKHDYCDTTNRKDEE